MRKNAAFVEAERFEIATVLDREGMRIRNFAMLLLIADISDEQIGSAVSAAASEIYRAAEVIEELNCMVLAPPIWLLGKRDAA